MKPYWEFVYAAYAVTWIGLAAYALSLWVRRRALEDARSRREDLSPDGRSGVEQGGP